MENMSVADIAAVTNRGYGYNDGFGMNGGWFWIVILLLFGRGNFFGNDQNLTSDEFIKRDIFNTNQNVSSTAATTQNSILASSCQTQRDVLESKYDTELGIANLGSQMQNCCCETNRNIDSVRYDTLLNFKDMQAQLASCCCDLKTAIHAEGEATRGLIQSNTIQDLRDKVADKDRELLTSGLAYQNTLTARTIVDSVLPRPIPAYPSCSPYVPYNYGCGCNTGCNY